MNGVPFFPRRIHDGLNTCNLDCNGPVGGLLSVIHDKSLDMRVTATIMALTLKYAVLRSFPSFHPQTISGSCCSLSMVTGQTQHRLISTVCWFYSTSACISSFPSRLPFLCTVCYIKLPVCYKGYIEYRRKQPPPVFWWEVCQAQFFVTYFSWKWMKVFFQWLFP